jgi:hypothetical protein
MAIQDVTSDQLTMANLIADSDVPLLTETIQIGDRLPLGSLIAMNPATRVGALVTATNQAQLFGVLRDHVMVAGNLGVVFISGAFIQDTLKCDESITVPALVPRLRELGIFARPSVHYPSYQLDYPPRLTNLSPNTAVAGSGALTVTVTGTDFLATAIASVDGTDVATTYVSVSQITFPFTPETPTGARTVRVRHGAAQSNPLLFTVT